MSVNRVPPYDVRLREGFTRLLAAEDEDKGHMDLIAPPEPSPDLERWGLLATLRMVRRELEMVQATLTQVRAERDELLALLRPLMPVSPEDPTPPMP